MSDNGSSALGESVRSAYLQRPRGAGERASSVPAHRDEQSQTTKPNQWDPWAPSLPASRDLSGSRRPEEPVPSYMQVGGPAFGSRPSTPPRRSQDSDSWTSSDLRGQAWGEVVPPFAIDDSNLSPGKRRLAELPRSSSPFHSLQETRHRQATAAQAAALSHVSDPDPTRNHNDSGLTDRSRGKSLDMDALTRNGAVDLFQQKSANRSSRPFDMPDQPGRQIRANILASLDDDFPSIRTQPAARTRVQTLDPSFSLEPLQRANSTPPYSGPVPVSSRDLPKSGLNPYPQSRTPQLQSSGHFTASTRENPLTALQDLSLESRSSEIGVGRKVSNNVHASNLGFGYSTGSFPSVASLTTAGNRSVTQPYDDYDLRQEVDYSHWQSQYQRTGTPNEYEQERRPSPFYNATVPNAPPRTHVTHPSSEYQPSQAFTREPQRQPAMPPPVARVNPMHPGYPSAQPHPIVVREQSFYRPQFQPSQFPEYANGYPAPFPPASFVGHPNLAQMNPTIRRHEDSIRNLRSPLLEEFRTAKNRRFELKDIFGHIVEFSGDQHGSRFIQQKLETASSAEKQAVFEEIAPNSLQLMTDVFGNYVIQKFFEFGNQVQKTALALQMQQNVLRLSLQMYGCRVVQKALEYILPEQQAALIRELDGHTLRCVKDQNGNHVVQKAIETVAPDQIQFIVDSFKGQVAVIASHPYGCRVIQRVLEHCTEEQQKSVLEELHRASESLIKDQYGNYVIQHVIERGKKEDREKIIAGVLGQVLELSKHKFASNVVEKCVAYGTYEDRQHIIDEILEVNSDSSSPLLAMMKDGFGNYVIQKLLDVTEGEQRVQLVAKIKPQLLALKRYTYGKHLASIERLLVLSESRGNGQSVNAPASVDTSSRPPHQAMMTQSRPELHVVPATPVDSIPPLNRP